MLPYSNTEFSRRFYFDSSDNPKLRELREKYRLAEVIASGRDEFDQQVLLMDWTHQRFKKFGRPTSPAQDALGILAAIEEGHTFFCAHYAKVLVSAAASIGWVDRELALRRHQGVAKDGSSEHAVTEIWSNQYGKWVMLDPTSNLYLEKDGVPLNAFEIRQEWFYHEGRDLVFVVGKDRKRYRKADLPIVLKTFAGFGDLAINPDELDKYGFIGYIPNTNLLDAREDYGQMFITKDALCAGTRWHQRLAPSNPAVDPYFPINQAALSFLPGEDGLQVRIQTLTPNFQAFEIESGSEQWTTAQGVFPWKLKLGLNELRVRSVNRFGVRGPVSGVSVEVGE
jgi:hypothetical protein